MPEFSHWRADVGYFARFNLLGNYIPYVRRIRHLDNRNRGESPNL